VKAPDGFPGCCYERVSRPGHLNNTHLPQTHALLRFVSAGQGKARIGNL
jgi:hypothetical protein